MLGLKPRPIEHEDLLQPFIDEVGRTEHAMTFRATREFPHLEQEDRGKTVGAGWFAESQLPSGLRYGFSVYSDTRRQNARGNDQATLTVELSLRHPAGQYQNYVWKTDGKSGVISQRPVQRGWGPFKHETVNGYGRDLEVHEARKLVKLAIRFATRQALPAPNSTAEREKTRFVEGIKNIRIGTG